MRIRCILAGLILAGLVFQAARAAALPYRQDGLAACAARVENLRAGGDPETPLYERYRDLRVIDAHNHDAANLASARIEELTGESAPDGLNRQAANEMIFALEG